MKTALTIVALLISSFTLKAQQMIKDTPYHSQPDLHRFDGVWEYSDNNITFRIILKTEKVLMKSPDVFIDLISGYHTYIKNNQIIQNSVGKEKTIKIGGFENQSKSKNIVSFSFTDMERPISIRGILELLTVNQLKWTVKNREGVRAILPGVKQGDRNIYVPNNIILTKVK
ncbi:MAG: hypothetical protein JWP37_2616 [Mucilaginibacter sp.]|nr:hypothetical protein [Mucilaginibacter sp.]